MLSTSRSPACIEIFYRFGLLDTVSCVCKRYVTHITPLIRQRDRSITCSLISIVPRDGGTGSQRADLPEISPHSQFSSRPEREAQSMHRESYQPPDSSTDLLALSLGPPVCKTPTKSLKMKGSASNVINIDRLWM
uniref:AlNc14C11G1406 protein n=1 Tax=Albugo laibachii Nc14 TaxID=890382 RepID=F0W328_9STRA|nr:AlNc14C11G1406 [Albugo laibachii Nc14]|eukprot:CCA15465.1 AlNc14C11G1406 [Albugo laibachii Nc14]